MLKLQLSQPKKDTRALQKVQKGQSSTKLIVRNLPFEATNKELRQLFIPFGQVSAMLCPQEKHLGIMILYNLLFTIKVTCYIHAQE